MNINKPKYCNATRNLQFFIVYIFVMQQILNSQMYCNVEIYCTYNVQYSTKWARERNRRAAAIVQWSHVIWSELTAGRPHGVPNQSDGRMKRTSRGMLICWFPDMKECRSGTEWSGVECTAVLTQTRKSDATRDGVMCSDCTYNWTEHIEQKCKCSNRTHVRPHETRA